MKNNKNNFVKSSFILGLLAIIPIVVIFLFFQIILNMVLSVCWPLLHSFGVDRIIGDYLSAIISLIIILVILYVIGGFVKTSFGLKFFEFVEESMFIHLPGYKKLKTVIMQFQKSDAKKMFERVAVADIFGTGVYNVCFITGESVSRFVIFVPTCPQPIAGFSYYLSKGRVIITKNIQLQEALRTTVSCGVGTGKIIQEVLNATRINVR